MLKSRSIVVRIVSCLSRQNRLKKIKRAAQKEQKLVGINEKITIVGTKNLTLVSKGREEKNGRNIKTIGTLR